MKKALLFIAIILSFLSVKANYGDYIAPWDLCLYKVIKPPPPWISDIGLVIQKKEDYPGRLFDRLFVNVFCDPTDENWWKMTVSAECAYDGIVGYTTWPSGLPKPIYGRVNGSRQWTCDVPPFSTFGQTMWELTRNEEFEMSTYGCTWCVHPSTFYMVSWEPE